MRADKKEGAFGPVLARSPLGTALESRHWQKAPFQTCSLLWISNQF